MKGCLLNFYFCLLLCKETTVLSRSHETGYDNSCLFQIVLLSTGEEVYYVPKTLNSKLIPYDEKSSMCFNITDNTATGSRYETGDIYAKNVKRAHVDQHLKWDAPKRWSKYT